jgi:hypothetical protein
MNIETARSTLKTKLQGTGIARVYATEPDRVDVPCIVVGNPVGSYDDTYGGELTYHFPIVVLVARSDSQRAITDVDPYIDPTGTASVRAALASMSQARVVGFSNYGAGYTVGDEEYAGVTFEVQVLSG